MRRTKARTAERDRLRVLHHCPLVGTRFIQTITTYREIVSEIQPGHAVAYHTMVEAHQELLLAIQSTYDSPLSIPLAPTT